MEKREKKNMMKTIVKSESLVHYANAKSKTQS